MKNPKRVAELLNELRTLAETDFERHRIDVLERDLTNPPQVEIVDDTHQKFDGVTYLRERGGHYQVKASIHRAVWSYYNGEIPEGYAIHHVDSNPDNNVIENFQCLTKAEHRSLHHSLAPIKICTCLYCGKTFESKKVNPPRFCSRFCYREHEKSSRQDERTCVICGKAFSCDRYAHTQTCSRDCAAQMRYQDHVPAPTTVRRICLVCGKEFETRKFRPAQTCSRSCAAVLRLRDYVPVPTTETRTCVICGNEFVTVRCKSTKTCSQHCAAVMRERQKRNQPVVENSELKSDGSS